VRLELPPEIAVNVEGHVAGGDVAGDVFAYGRAVDDEVLWAIALGVVRKPDEAGFFFVVREEKAAEVVERGARFEILEV